MYLWFKLTLAIYLKIFLKTKMVSHKTLKPGPQLVVSFRFMCFEHNTIRTSYQLPVTSRYTNIISYH